jgi:hypothetical protein
MGYRAFELHGWHDGDPRQEAANVLRVAKVLGDRMTPMLDPANELAHLRRRALLSVAPETVVI